MLRLQPEGTTHPNELPSGHGHLKLVASTPTMDPGVEEYERLVGGFRRADPWITAATHTCIFTLFNVER